MSYWGPSHTPVCLFFFVPSSVLVAWRGPCVGLGLFFPSICVRLPLCDRMINSPHHGSGSTVTCGCSGPARDISSGCRSDMAPPLAHLWTTESRSCSGRRACPRSSTDAQTPAHPRPCGRVLLVDHRASKHRRRRGAWAAPSPAGTPPRRRVPRPAGARNAAGLKGPERAGALRWLPAREAARTPLAVAHASTCSGPPA